LETELVIIETPRGKGQKYDYDPASGYFKLKKVMPSGMVFPFDFGYIPGTIGGDGDPLDVLVISELDTFSGCAIECRIIGALKADQTERNGDRMRNDRIIAIPEVSVQHASVRKIADLPKGVMNEIENFFKSYNEQAGKSFHPLKRLNPQQALSLVSKARLENSQTKLIQIFLPVRDEDGKDFSKRLWKNLNDKLTKTFGGLTIYSRAPATGLWNDGEGNRVKDEMIVYEVLTDIIDESYWKSLKDELQRKLRQEEILILVSDINRL